MKNVKIWSVVLLLLSLSIAGVSALSTPVATTLAVEMTNDPTVHKAATILEHNAGVHLVKYGSIEYSLLIHRTVNPVIWISHGSDQGIEVQEQVESWSFAKDLVERTMNKDIVLTCDSSKLLQYGVSSSEVITFSGEIDAELSALVFSYVLNNKESTVQQINSRVTELITNPNSMKPLYLSQTELISHSVSFIITTILVVIKIRLAWQQAKGVLNTGGSSGVLGKIKDVITSFMKKHPLAVKVGKIISATWSILNKLLTWLNSLSWWEKALWAGAIIANVIAIIASGSSTLWVTIVYAIASYTAWALPAIADYLDADGYVG